MIRPPIRLPSCVAMAADKAHFGDWMFYLPQRHPLPAHASRVPEQSQAQLLTSVGQHPSTDQVPLDPFLEIMTSFVITNSIVSVSTTPNFSFNPATMTQNTTYYLIAGAGENLNGSINFADTCLNFSNAIPVTWRPLPEVTFTTTNSSLCAGDCEDITVNLTGNPPFSLTYSTPFSGNQVQVFPTNNGLITLCPPVGSPLGSIQLQATALSDAFCTCQ